MVGTRRDKLGANRLVLQETIKWNFLPTVVSFLFMKGPPAFQQSTFHTEANFGQVLELGMRWQIK
jgi:GH24 family phage-related lysozyme (muramidase)